MYWYHPRCSVRTELLTELLELFLWSIYCSLRKEHTQKLPFILLIAGGLQAAHASALEAIAEAGAHGYVG